MTDREVSGNHGIEHWKHQRIIDEANENPAEQTANILDACSDEKDEKLKKVEARISELSQNDEEIYNQVDELLIKISTSMLMGDDRGTMTSYKELDDLLSKVDNTPDGKDKHLKALEAYKEFLEKCKLKERDDELTKVEARISELRQDDEEKQNNEEIYKQVDQILIDITTFMMLNNDTLTMAAYKKLDNLLSKVDNTPDGKNKHLIALRYYKEFLEKCKLKERDEELMRVENLITKLSQE